MRKLASAASSRALLGEIGCPLQLLGQPSVAQARPSQRPPNQSPGDPLLQPRHKDMDALPAN